MKVDTKGNKIALAPTATERMQTIATLQDYLERTGLTITDFASRIGYSKVTLYAFAKDRYHEVGKTSAHIEKAVLAFIAAHPIEPLTQAHGEIYETSNVRVIRETFQQLLPKPVAYMIYAPPGSQKSFVLEHQVAQLNREELHKNGHGRRAYYVYARQGITPRDLVRRIAIACGSRGTQSIEQTLSNMRFDFQTRRVLLVIDEAQHLGYESLEVVRELLDQPPYFSVLFAGSHDLKQKFDRMAATLEQWNSRIIAKVLLPGLLREEAAAIAWREFGDSLTAMDRAKADALVQGLIDVATTTDAFTRGRSYINVRTLTNSLNQLKARALGATGAEEAPCA